jgi:hypothetical protein
MEDEEVGYIVKRLASKAEPMRHRGRQACMVRTMDGTRKWAKRLQDNCPWFSSHHRSMRVLPREGNLCKREGITITVWYFFEIEVCHVPLLPTPSSPTPLLSTTEASLGDGRWQLEQLLFGVVLPQGVGLQDGPTRPGQRAATGGAGGARRVANAPRAPRHSVGVRGRVVWERQTPVHTRSNYIFRCFTPGGKH